MKLNNYYPTKNLKDYILELYQRLENMTKKDGVYKPLDIRFETADSGFSNGEYCFTDDKGYRFISLERGMIIDSKITDNLFEIAYWTIESAIFWMALEYEKRHRIKHQDNRRMLFAKEIQYFEAIGDEYAQRARLEIESILKKAPFQDELFQ